MRTETGYNAYTNYLERIAHEAGNPTMTLDTLTTTLTARYGADRAKALLANLRDARQLAEQDRNALLDAVASAREAICPPPCKDIDPAFWLTEDGQFLANAEYYAYADELITLAEAARMVRGSAENRDLQAILRYIKAGKLRTVRRPATDFKYQRKGAKPQASRTVLVLRSDVAKLAAEKRS